jgi:hypothetical protein
LHWMPKDDAGISAYLCSTSSESDDMRSL